MKKFTLTIFTMVFLAGVIVAQELLPPVGLFSHKKTTYITLKDGSTIEGRIKSLDRKKGILEEVKLEMGDGKKIKVKPNDIDYMYLPMSGYEKMINLDNFLTDVSKWQSDDLDQAMFGEGYAYFEASQVKVKKKEFTLMLQLLNPHFSKNIKVYDDPMASETASVGVAGFKLAGGLQKSYFIKKKGKPAAVRLKKKAYEDEFKAYFSSCSKVTKMKPNWEDFGKHVYLFATECSK